MTSRRHWSMCTPPRLGPSQRSGSPATSRPRRHRVGCGDGRSEPCMVGGVTCRPAPAETWRRPGATCRARPAAFSAAVFMLIPSAPCPLQRSRHRPRRVALAFGHATAGLSRSLLTPGRAPRHGHRDARAPIRRRRRPWSAAPLPRLHRFSGCAVPGTGGTIGVRVECDRQPCTSRCATRGCRCTAFGRSCDRPRLQQTSTTEDDQA
jgi:hypothetical protein